MSYPFTYFNGEKLDLNKQSHRDEVIRRNKILEKAIVDGIDHRQAKITVIVKTELDCLKCGSSLQEEDEDALDDLVEIFGVIKLVPNLKCSCCGTVYEYSINEECYYPIIKKSYKITATN